MPTGIALMIAIGVLVWRARRLGVPRWRGAVLMLLVGTAPALTLVSRASWHGALSTPLPMVQALLYIVAAAVVIARSAGRRIPDGIEAAVALAPIIVALAAYVLALGRLATLPLRFGEDTTLRVFAEGEGESLESVALGAAGALVLLAVASWSALRAPVESGERVSGAPTLGPWRWAIAIAVGVAANALVYLTARNAGWVRSLGAPAFLFGLALTWRLEARERALHESPAVGERASKLATTWLLAMLVVGLACIVSTRAISLQATAGESIDPTQRSKILHAMEAATHALSWQVPLAALASVVAPGWLALRNRAALPNARRAVPVALALVACALLRWSGRSAVAQLYASQQPLHDERAVVEGVDPVSVALDDRLRLDHALEGPSFLATQAGALLASPSRALAPRPFDDAAWTRMAADAIRDPDDPLLVVDRGLTVGRLDAALEPVLRHRHTSFRWVLGRRGALGTGTYALLENGPDDRGAVSLEWRRKVAVEPARPHDPEAAMVTESIAVRLQADALETLVLSGAHGRYRRFESATVHRVPRSDPGQSDSLPSMVPEDSRAFEVLLCVSPDTDVTTLTSLIRAFLAVPPPDGWSREPSPIWLARHPVLRFVVTTDMTAFGHVRVTED